MKKWNIAVILIFTMCFGMVFHAAGEGDLQTALTYQTENGKMTISGTMGQNGTVDAGSRIVLFILKPGYSNPNQLSDAQMEQAVCYMDSRVNLVHDIKAAEPFSFEFQFTDKMPFGKYEIYVSSTNWNGLTEQAKFIYQNVDPTESAKCVAAFQTTQADGLNRLLQQYTVETPILDVSAIPELSQPGADFGAAFVMARNLAEAGLLSAEVAQIESMDDIYRLLRAAVMINALSDGKQDQMVSSLQRYGADASVLLEGLKEKYYDRVYDVMTELSPELSEPQKFYDTVRLGISLGYIYQGSYADIAEALDRYPEILGIDRNKILQMGVTFDKNAPYVKNDSISAYVDGMGDYIEEIAQKVLKDKDPDGGRGNSGGGSGGSSGGSGSGGGYQLPVNSGTASVPVLPDDEETTADITAYDDLGQVLWAQDSIYQLTELGILSGVGDGKFEPDREVTREEFVKMILSAFPMQAGEGAGVPFVDCPVDSWYYPYVEKAYYNQVIQGISEHEFGAGKSITRQDVAVICMHILEQNQKIPNLSDAGAFKDAEQIAGYAKLSVDSLSQIGIITGYDDGSFRPEQSTTRAQAAVMVSRLMSYVGQW